ncbi:MAG: septum formation initiator family protein [Firmicutes bacterium]|jgi:cell division protein FtsL|nr:septum formation initiator family protein [Bacillota bacterium]
MAENRGRKNRRIKPWMVICLVLVLWVGFHFLKNASQNYKLKQDIITLQKEIEALELRGRQLEEEIANWQSPEYVERVAREELGLVKPGETVYILSKPLTSDVELDVEKR